MVEGDDPDTTQNKVGFEVKGTAARRGAAAKVWFCASVGLTCGALATCVVLAPKSGASPDMGLAWLLFLGSSVHVASTGWLFTNTNVRRYAREKRGRYVWAPLGLVATGLIVSVVATPHLMSWAVLLVLAWQLHHFQKQNIGQVALTGVSLGLAPLRRGERTAICTTGAAGIAAVCAHPALLQLSLRPPLAGAAVLLATALFLLGVAGGALVLTRRLRSDRSPKFCLMYGLALLFPLPIFVFGSPYAAVAGMTLAHGLQYLLLMGLVAAAGEPRERMSGVAALCTLAALGGVVLNLMSHLHGDGLPLRPLFGVYLGLLATHFVVDAGIWRLREPFVRAFLSQRIGYLVCSARSSGVPMSVADRSVADIESGTWLEFHGKTLRKLNSAGSGATPARPR